MAILHLLRPAQGGMLTQIRHLIPGLIRSGYPVHIAGPPILEDWAQGEGIPFTPIDVSANLSYRDLRVLWPLRKVMSKPWDLVHLHGYKAALMAHLVGVRQRQVISVHNHPQYWRGIPWASSLIRSAQAVIAVSRDLSGSLDHPSVHYIPNGVPIPEAVMRPQGSKVVLMASRFIPQKGILEVLEALPVVLEAHPDLQFWLAGDGPLAQRVREKGEKWIESGHLRLLGFIPLEPLWARVDLFILPSYSEGLPLTILEAMGHGVPVLATDVGGIPELISHGVSGHLIPAKDPLALAEAISDLLSSPQRREDLGRAGREHVSQHHGIEQMIEKTASLYRTLLEVSP